MTVIKWMKQIVLGLLTVILLTVLILIFVHPGVAYAAETDETAAEYEAELFDTSEPITVDILMDADVWQAFLDNASEKEWTSCDVVINGTRFDNVGIRTKGDSSLDSVAYDKNSDRYSFKLKFDKYVDGQTAWGLDKLNLNNNYGDASNMKEAMIYDMFASLGADASLYNYAAIYVNGEYWGVYLALEPVDDAFLARNYGSEKGKLYKPGEDEIDDFEDYDETDEAKWELMEMLSMLDPDTELDAELTELLTSTLGENWSETITADEMGSDEAWDDMYWDMGGADLNYIDDNLENYWSIWNCEVTKTNNEDHSRVVAALKNISSGKSLEQYLNMDNVLKYMAVHNFSVNYDSLTGDGPHNYYLYESGGKLNLIPWDYNLCFGSYVVAWDADPTSTEYASSVINTPIDDTWAQTSFFDAILQNEAYLAKYHEYYQQFVDEYVLGGGFRDFYERTRAVIDELVKTDPNAFYSYEAYDDAAKMLAQAVRLRGESVKGQLDGTIPSTFDGQTAAQDALVDASSVNIAMIGGDNTGDDFYGEFDEAALLEYIRELAEQLNNAE